MGVEHGGPDKGPETGDKPTKPDSASGPPPDNPGSPGQQSRIESLKAAGWNINGQQESGGERGHNNNESSSTGSSEENASAAPKTEKGTGPETGSQPGDGKSEPGRPKPETGEAAPRDEGKREPRTTEPGERHPKANTEPQSTSARNGETVKNTEPLGDKDTRTESGDKPRADDTGKPPTETPESTRPMTRRESLQNAGWDLRDPPATSTDQSSEKTDQNAAAQERHGEGEQASDAGRSDLGEGERAETSSKVQPQSDGPRTDEAVKSNPLGQEQDADKSLTDRPGLQSGRVENGEASRPQETGSPSDTDELGDRSAATGQAPEGRANPPTTEPVGPEEGSNDASPTLPSLEQDPQGTDKLADTVREPRAEATGETTDPIGEPGDPQEAMAHSRESEQNATEASPDGSADDGHQSQPETSRPPENPTDGEQTDKQRVPGDPPSPPEEADDRDRNAETESAESAEPSFNTLPYFAYNPNGHRTLTLEEARRLDNETTRPSDNEDSNSEVPPWLAGTLEPQSGPTRDDVGTRGRGEVGSPETDPAKENPAEPERESKGQEGLRRFLKEASNIKDATGKYAEPLTRNLERVKPTGQLCGVRANYDHIKAPDQAIKGGDTVLGAVGTTIVMAQIVRLGVNLMQHRRMRAHANS
ncbi:hypothetical protein LUW76_08165 [Actinomadura madurae]|uniref:hypothetical protein n=1 Tax=Actinomadura madurae TaxID=1993 RepID=UPI002025F016|nr:hypothetical protein [Actinomadura madurae]URM94306.1 hypothetical protein LUW76_08165 [Actinomadura madurae]